MPRLLRSICRDYGGVCRDYGGEYEKKSGGEKDEKMAMVKHSSTRRIHHLNRRDEKNENKPEQ